MSRGKAANDNDVSTEEINKCFQESDIKKIRQEEKRYPYLVRHIYSGVYKQYHVEFTSDEGQPPVKSALTIVCPEAYQSGTLTNKARNMVIGSADYLVKRDNVRLCVIFSENDCVFCEVNEPPKPSDNPPSGGINADLLWQ